MARKTKEDQLLEIHGEAIAEFERIQYALRDERLQCLKDRRFYSIPGAQWEGALGQQFENKPKLEFNKIHLSVIRIINEYRNNRIDVNFVSKEGSEYSDLAETCNGLYRADEQDSQAEEAYDNAFEEAVGGGMGAWRLRAEYEDDEDMENDKQRIRIEPIYDADSSVFFDLNAKRMDKSDAKCCFVITAMSPEAFKEEWGDYGEISVPKNVQNTYFDWNSPDVVYIAEYFRVEEKITKVHVFESKLGEDIKIKSKDLTEEKMTELEALQYEEVRVRKIKEKKIHKYILNGNRVLEDSGYIAGSCIPIVPVYGKRWFVDNIERCMGHVRLSKDVQRLKNMQMSKLAEISALSAIEKPIVTPEQIAGHEMNWAEDNVKNNPYLLLNPLTDMNGNIQAAGPLAYTKPPTIPAALAALVQMADQDMNDLLGNQQNGEKIVSNISADAIEMVQNNLGMQTFIYVSNMAKAIKRSGEIYLPMAKDVFVEPSRKMKVIGSQDEVDSIELNRPIINDKGETEYENDLSEAKFDVYASIGPSSSSKRDAVVRSLIELLRVTTDPENKQVLEAMIMMNMEGEGINEVNDYYRQKLIKMGVVKPTKEEQAQLEALMAAQSEPTAQEKYFEAAAQNESAKAAKAIADTEEAMAKSEKARADTLKVLSDLSIDEQKHVIELAQKIKEQQEPQQQIQVPVQDLQQIQ